MLDCDWSSDVCSSDLESENLRCVVWRVLAQYDRLRANFAAHAAARTADEVSAALEDLDHPRHGARDSTAVAAK
jgi:hypothetical protein